MAIPKSQVCFTVEQYLAIERKSDERLYYLDGEIYLMAGESPNHATICMNLAIEIGYELKRSPEFDN